MSQMPEATSPEPLVVRRSAAEKVNWRSSIPFLALQLTPLLVFFTGVTTRAVLLGVLLFWGRMFFITGGYHRYFAHRSYKLARFPQFVMAFGGTTAAQKGPLWWAGHHRNHHTFSDTERDAHTPLKGFWWSHMGWIISNANSEVPEHRIRDFSRFPELRLLNKYDFIGPWAVAIASYLIAGWSGLVVGFFCSTVALWHATFTVNSLAHVFGRRRYATEDTSRNSALIAFFTMGEGWHNNHHYHQASARQGFFWWEYDVTFYILRALSWVGIVKDLKVPSARVRESNRIADGSFDIGTFRAHWGKATAAVVATQATLGSRLHDQKAHASEALAHTRESAEAAVEARKASLESMIESARDSADDLARLSRRRERDLGFEA